MSGTPKADRLKQARINAGYASAAEAAQKFNWPEAGYRHHENGTRGYGADAAKKYGRAFKVKPAWLLGLEFVNGISAMVDASPDRLDVNGSVAAGVWRESEHWNDERRFMIRLPSPVAGARRFGVCVEGNSMNLFYQPGEVLDCISIFDREVRPQSGDHVIVQRMRADGLREITVKEYRETTIGGSTRYVLAPRSTDASFQPITYPGPDGEGADQDNGERVEVIAFVVANYPPRTIELFRRMGLIEEPAD